MSSCQPRNKRGERQTNVLPAPRPRGNVKQRWPTLPLSGERGPSTAFTFEGRKAQVGRLLGSSNLALARQFRLSIQSYFIQPSLQTGQLSLQTGWSSRATIRGSPKCLNGRGFGGGGRRDFRRLLDARPRNTRIMGMFAAYTSGAYTPAARPHGTRSRRFDTRVAGGKTHGR